jgi:hypothetical protein
MSERAPSGLDYPFDEDRDLPDHQTTLAHLKKLPDVALVEANGDGDYKFRFRGHFFWVMVNGHAGGTYFFVEDESCPAEVRDAVVEHFRPLFAAAWQQDLEQSAWNARRPYLVIGCMLAAVVLPMVIALTIASCSH